jgi:DNA-binding MarR family transcriptional regulator
MLEMFEKLINEHGSSVILKERLELFSDKYSVLEDKLEEAVQKNSVIETENQGLRENLLQAEKEIERLQKLVDSAIDSQNESKLDEVKERILKAFFEANSHTTISNLAAHIGLDESLVQYHIDQLKEKGLVAYGPLMANSPATFKISPSGRKIVVEEIGI